MPPPNIVVDMEMRKGDGAVGKDFNSKEAAALSLLRQPDAAQQVLEPGVAA